MKFFAGLGFLKSDVGKETDRNPATRIARHEDAVSGRLDEDRQTVRRHAGFQISPGEGCDGADDDGLPDRPAADGRPTRRHRANARPRTLPGWLAPLPP